MIGGATVGTCVSRLESGSWRHITAPLTSRLHAAAAAAPDRLYLLVSHTTRGIRVVETFYGAC